MELVVYGTQDVYLTKKFLFFLSKLRKIYAVNYNILKIMSGMGDLAYSN